MKTRSKHRLRFSGAIIAATLVCVGAAKAGVVAQWHFDESAGVTASDSVGQFHGALSAAGASFVPGGVAGNAISLNRSDNGFASMSNVLGFLTGDFSIVLWVKTTETGNDTIALAKHEAFSENGYFIAINPTGGGGAPGKATLDASELVALGVTSSTTVNDGNWHQIVGVFQANGSERIYVDGSPAEATGASEPIVANNAPFLIGAVNVNGNATGRYTGLVDEVQVYDQALTDAEVDHLFANPAQTIGGPLLSVKLINGTVRVFWPSPSSGFQLQQNTDLNTANWVAPSESVQDDGANKFIIVNPPVDDRFYRLFKPGNP